jgi:hypothetical protein
VNFGLSVRPLHASASLWPSPRLRLRQPYGVTFGALHVRRQAGAAVLSVHKIQAPRITLQPEIDQADEDGIELAPETRSTYS